MSPCLRMSLQCVSEGAAGDAMLRLILALILLKRLSFVFQSMSQRGALGWAQGREEACRAQSCFLGALLV